MANVSSLTTNALPSDMVSVLSVHLLLHGSTKTKLAVQSSLHSLLSTAAVHITSSVKTSFLRQELCVLLFLFLGSLISEYMPRCTWKRRYRFDKAQLQHTTHKKFDSACRFFKGFRPMSYCQPLKLWCSEIIITLMALDQTIMRTLLE